jgi:hypothetical protein
MRTGRASQHRKRTGLRKWLHFNQIGGEVLERGQTAIREYIRSKQVRGDRRERIFQRKHIAEPQRQTALGGQEQQRQIGDREGAGVVAADNTFIAERRGSKSKRSNVPTACALRLSASACEMIV